eukprot:scaffold96148_cov32-Tisochrysis_lutea.AAC.2
MTITTILLGNTPYVAIAAASTHPITFRPNSLPSFVRRSSPSQIKALLLGPRTSAHSIASAARPTPGDSRLASRFPALSRAWLAPRHVAIEGQSPSTGCVRPLSFPRRRTLALRLLRRLDEAGSPVNMDSTIPGGATSTCAPPSTN